MNTQASNSRLGNNNYHTIHKGAYTMNLNEAMETTVSKQEAQREIAKHGKDTPEITFEAFAAEYGDHETYEGGDVLGWLGY